MKILNQVNYIGGLGADRWIGSGFRDAFKDLKHEFFFYTLTDDLAKRIKEIKPDIIITSQSELGRGKLPILLDCRRRGIKIVMRVDSFFYSDPRVLDGLTHADPADLYVAETEDPRMDGFKKVTGKLSVIVANAAHHRYHFPVAPVRKYACDIVFMGAMLPAKREGFAKLLFPLMKKYNVRIYGPGWTLKDNALRATALIARKLHLGLLNEKIQKVRLSVPEDEENQLYSSAKICVNIHERGATLNVQDNLILNERTFRIPACGGFEVCDYVPPLRRYFSKDEVVMACPPRASQSGDWTEDWFRKIDYYMAHEAERKKIQEAGTARAIKDHTYLNRARYVLRLLGFPADTRQDFY